MIDIDALKESDKGRGVVYCAGHPGAPLEDGRISSWNENCIFVRYRGPRTWGVAATSPEDLRWKKP